METDSSLPCDPLMGYINPFHALRFFFLYDSYIYIYNTSVYPAVNFHTKSVIGITLSVSFFFKIHIYIYIYIYIFIYLFIYIYYTSVHPAVNFHTKSLIG